MVAVFKEFSMYWGGIKAKKPEQNKKPDNCIIVQQCSDRSPETLKAQKRGVANLGASQVVRVVKNLPVNAGD